MLLAACALVLLLSWHGYDGHPVIIWEHYGKYQLDDLEMVLKVAGGVLLAAALLAWPKRPA